MLASFTFFLRLPSRPLHDPLIDAPSLVMLLSLMNAPPFYSLDDLELRTTGGGLALRPYSLKVLSFFSHLALPHRPLLLGLFFTLTASLESLYPLFFSLRSLHKDFPLTLLL